jgi:hypothetical protein
MILDTPRGDLAEISSSSYGLSLFSSKAGSRHDAATGATPGGSSSVSIGDLWPDIDKLYEVGHEGTSAIAGGTHVEIQLRILNRSPEGQKERGRVWCMQLGEEPH